MRKVFCLVVLILFKVLSAIGSDFGYTNEEQDKWSKEFPLCAGLKQSPIDISNSKAAVLENMPGIELVGYNNVLPGNLKMTNNGHSVSFSIEDNHANNVNKIFKPYIFGGTLPNNYEFESFHFHWGLKNYRGSEHIINDVSYPLELHIIHRNVQYNNLTAAVNEKDGLAVLGIMFEPKETPYRPLNAFLQQIKAIQKPHSEVILPKNIKLKYLMPYDTEIFYTYQGSLTTPPCSEAVTWIIFPDPILCSFDQLALFRTLKDSHNEKLADNYRNIQPVGERAILKRLPG